MHSFLSPNLPQRFTFIKTQIISQTEGPKMPQVPLTLPERSVVRAAEELLCA